MYILQKFDHKIGFWQKRQFFAENCRKSQKIVITTSTPGHTESRQRFSAKLVKEAEAVPECLFS
jgi:hypothetical protein